MIDYQEYWNLLDNALHAESSDEFFESYTKEILFYLGDRNIMVDTGCGSGEILFRLKDKFKKIYALDFSEKMLNKAKDKFDENIRHVSFHKINMLDIEKVITEKVDVIYNNAVIQYIDENDVRKFIEKSKLLLKKNGRIVLMNIPGIEHKDLFQIEYYRTATYFSFNQLIKRYFALKWINFKSKIKNPSYYYDDGIGYWHNPDFFHKVAGELGLKCQIFNSASMVYRYRFHVVLDIV